jgi:hypothetical protein
MSAQDRRHAGWRAEWLYPLTHWNWKVSLLTAVLRGLACVWALRSLEPHARNRFGLVEAAFVLATCGFFSALQQQSLKIRREALAWLVCVVVVPLVSLGMDAGLHLWIDGRQTVQLGIAALIFTLVSASFHWHLIRNGALLVGEDSGSLTADLRSIPRLTVSYCTAPVAWVTRFAGDSAEESAKESAAA